MFKRLFSKSSEKKKSKPEPKNIQELRDNAFASRDDSMILAAYQELDGFKFLFIRLVSPLNVRTFDGGVVTFECQNKTIVKESDNFEINTDFTNKYGLGITELEIDYDEELEDMIKNQTMKTIHVKVKKKEVTVDVTNQALLDSIVSYVPDEEEE